MSREDRSTYEFIDSLALRYELLLAIEDEERERPQLVDRLESSEATVYRGIKELEGLGLVEYGTNGFRPTTSGQVLLDAFGDFKALVRDVSVAQAVLNELLTHTPPDAEFLRGCEIVEGGGASTHAPGTRIGNLLAEATLVKGMGKSHSQAEAAAVFHDTVVDGDLDAEFIYDAAFYDYLQGSDDPRIEALLACDRHTAYRLPEVPFGLFILEFPTESTTVVLLGYDDDGFLHGLLENDSPSAVEWAENAYSRYKQRAEKP